MTAPFRPPSLPGLAAPSRVRQVALISLGVAIILAGFLAVPLPGPFGLPLMVIGAAIILRNSRRSKRLFVRLRRRYPQILRPVDRLLHGRRGRRPPDASQF